jgi:large-conductance mechanosensitive channel
MSERKASTHYRSIRDAVVIAILAVVIYVASAFFDVINKVISWFMAHESLQLDEFTTVLIFLVVAFVVYGWRRRNEALQEMQRRERAEAERDRLIPHLESALYDVQVLSKLLPICGECKKVRDDKGYWDEVELYLQAHFDMRVTYGMCPECAKRLYRRAEGQKQRKPGSFIVDDSRQID